jgi:hypothetical protein
MANGNRSSSIWTMNSARTKRVPLTRLSICARFSIVLACTSFCGAQPAAPPKVLVLVRQQFKAGKSAEREKLERITAAIYNRLDVPVYWMETAAFTGPSEALFFGPYDSFEAVEQARATLGPLYDAHPELARLQAGIDDALSSETTILAVRRDSPAVSGINLAQARFLRMLVVRTRPGEEPALARDLAPSVVYEVSSGMSGPAFLIFQTMPAIADIPSANVTHGTVVEDSVYAIEPDLSHVSRAFAQQDQSFWTKP